MIKKCTVIFRSCDGDLSAALSPQYDVFVSLLTVFCTVCDNNLIYLELRRRAERMINKAGVMSLVKSVPITGY